jgi:serine/threonine-protein kinase
VAAGVVLGIIVVLGALVGLAAWRLSNTPSSTPYVVGLSTAQAGAALRTTGLTGELGGIAPTSLYPPGSVLAQMPPVGTKVAPGSSVRLVFAQPPQPVTMPDLTLDSAATATIVVQGALMEPLVYQQYSAVVPYGYVVTQLPQAGWQATTGSQAAAYVSLGPGTGGGLVPDLVGKASTDTSVALAAAHLVPKEIGLIASGGPAGVVLDQAPEAGARVPIGTPVALLVSAAPPQ